MNKKLLISLITGLALVFAQLSFATPATPYSSSVEGPAKNKMAMMAYGTDIYISNDSPALIQVHVPYTSFYRVLYPWTHMHLINEGYFGDTALELSDANSYAIFYSNNFVPYDAGFSITVRGGIYYVQYI